MKKLLLKITILILTLSLSAFFIACDDNGGEDTVQTTGTFEYQIVTGTRDNESGEEEEYKYYKITGYQVSVEDSEKISEGKYDEIDSKYREVTIPETYKDLPVEEIDAAAFANQLILTRVTIGSNIKTIGAGAFSGCTNLEYLEIPFVGKTEDAVDGERVFGHLFGSGATNEGNTEITSKVHARMNSIDGSEVVTGEDVTFMVPTSLKEVKVTEATIVTECAFYGMTTLQKITFDKATEIESHAFYGCTALQSFDISNIVNIYQYAFSNCTALKSVDFKNASKLEFIDRNAFSACQSLFSNLISDEEEFTTLSFNEALKEIGSNAFADCSAIRFLDLTNAKKVGEMAFANCFTIEGVTLNADGVYGDSIFMGCVALEEDKVENLNGKDIKKLFGKTDTEE